MTRVGGGGKAQDGPDWRWLGDGVWWAVGMGTRGDGEVGLSASAQKRINSTRSNGLTAKRAHRGAAPRGPEEGVGLGRSKGRG